MSDTPSVSTADSSLREGTVGQSRFPASFSEERETLAVEGVAATFADGNIPLHFHGESAAGGDGFLPPGSPEPVGGGRSAWGILFGGARNAFFLLYTLEWGCVKG